MAHPNNRLFNRQMSVRSFLLKEKNQKFKAAPASLLSPYITLFAPQTRFAQTGDALGRSIPVARFTLTSRGQSLLPSSFSLASLFSPSASGSQLLTSIPYYIICMMDWPNVRGVKQIPSGAWRNFGCLSEASFRNFSGAMWICSLWSVSLDFLVLLHQGKRTGKCCRTNKKLPLPIVSTGKRIS